MSRDLATLRIATHAAAVGIWEYRPDSDRLDWDDQVCVIHGVPESQFSGCLGVWEARVLLDDLATFRSLFEPGSQADGQFEADFRIVRPDASLCWLRVRGEIRRHDDGAAIRYIGACWEITALKSALEQMRVGEMKLRALFDLSPVGFALNRMSDGRFLEGNAALCEPTGYTLPELRQLRLRDLTAPEYAALDGQSEAQLRADGHTEPVIREYLRKDGQRYPVQVQSVLFKDHRGLEMIWSVVQDISERQRIERMKSEFVSTVSHELRTPLTSIGGALTLLLSGTLGVLPDSALPLLQIAHRNSLRLTALINDLLDMEKMAAGQMDFRLRRQNLRPLLAQSVEDTTSFAEPYSVRINLDASAADCLVEVDEGRLLQALGNLISNAVKFSHAGGVVEVVASRLPDSVRIAVIDHGEGIALAFQSRLFSKFSQADASDTRRKGGTGLGLAITRELLAHMGGEVGFVSVPGQGATFWIDLPCADGSGPEGSC